ncbi:helix-turn-helix transcriptional regulator [Novosphingobium sp.]|uniref:helix-turn-helix transcriptional regulator n=1 Tax=Novosphingobium sp. TaxID=1874826 RepID=UPI003341BE2F
MDLTPTILARMHTPAGCAELVEWHWPTTLDFTRTEDSLMIEMSLPPLAAEASACLSELDPARRCHMGTLFARWPGIMVSGRSEGGHIRVVRCVFAPDRARALMAGHHAPSPTFLKSLLAIRNEGLRALMHLLRRELVNPVDRSEPAIAALTELIAIEFGRLIARPAQPLVTGRLAAWQFRRIRERIGRAGAVPSVAELAALCGISVRHLHRQFFALTGATVADYIENARIEQAKRLLYGHGDLIKGPIKMPIKAIAEACGFAHANSFARAFRRSTGLTPMAFRQRGQDAPPPLTTH